MTPRLDILPALRAACHDAVDALSRGIVRIHIDAGDHRCACIGPTTAEVARAAGVPLEQARRALVRALGEGAVLADGTSDALRWWPRGMAGELWESTGA